MQNQERQTPNVPEISYGSRFKVKIRTERCKAHRKIGGVAKP